MQLNYISLAIICVISAIVPLLSDRIPKKLIPETVFLIIFGMIVGPNVLNIVQIDEGIDLISELGMMFLFLLAGYEINPKDLIGSVGKSASVAWFASFTLALIVTFLVFGNYIGDAHTSIAYAIALSTTAVGTLMPILKERNLLHTKVGKAVIAHGSYGELMPILAIAILLSSRRYITTVIVLIIFIVICIIISIFARKFAVKGNKIFDFLVDRASTSSQTVIRTVIMVLLVLVAVSAYFYLDSVLGAFAAGFILRFVLPKGNAGLENKLEAIGYGFFIPLFFVCSGANINPVAIIEKPVLFVVFIIALMLVRFLPVLLFTNISSATRKLPIAQKIEISFYSTTALPLIVAVTNIAVNSDIMSQLNASVLVAAGAVTVFLMPLLSLISSKIAKNNNK